MKHKNGMGMLLASSIPTAFGLYEAASLAMVVVQVCGGSTGAMACRTLSALGVLFCPPNKERSDFALLEQ